jgi:hypothetical protein
MQKTGLMEEDCLHSDSISPITKSMAADLKGKCCIQTCGISNKVEIIKRHKNL